MNGTIALVNSTFSFYYCCFGGKRDLFLLLIKNHSLFKHDLIHSITKHHDLKVNQNLFAVSKADITGDGMDEIITCSVCTNNEPIL